MPDPTLEEHRKRLRERLRKETLDRQKALEAQLGALGKGAPPAAVTPQPLRVGPVPTASPRPLTSVAASAPPRTPVAPGRQPAPGEMERVQALVQFGSISNQLNEIKRLELAGTDQVTIRTLLAEKGLSKDQAATLLGIRDRERSGALAERRTPVRAPLAPVFNALDVPPALALSAIPGTEVHQRAREAREGGKGTIGAAVQGFQEADLPPGVKLGARLLFDPLILAPGIGTPGALGAATRGVAAGARSGARAATAPVRAAGRLGTAGIREAVPGSVGREGIVRGTPRALDPEQLATAAAQSTTGQRVQGLQQANRTAGRIPSRQIAEAGVQRSDQALPASARQAAEAGPPGAAPPTRPPTVTGAPGPAGIATAPPVPAGVQEALGKAARLREIDAPGSFGRFLDKIPGLKHAQRYLRPANVTPERIQTAFVAEGAERTSLSTSMFPSRTKLLDDINQLFGRNASTGGRANARFIGTPKQSVPIQGTMLDIAQRPHLYELLPAQREFLAKWQSRNSELMQNLIKRYGADVAEFPAAEGGVFLSNVDVADDVLEALDTSRAGAARRGRGKTRVFEDAATRMQRDKNFKPETNLHILQTAMDEWKAGVASKEVFGRGVGGLTRVQAVDLTHPGLRAAKDQVANRIESLKGRIATTERQAGQSTAGAKQAGRQAEQTRRRVEPLQARIRELQGRKAQAGPADTQALDAEIARIADELTEITAELETFAESGIIRPPWGVGLTDQEITAVARQEGLNPFRADWFDAVDSQVISEARRGLFKLPSSSVTDLRRGQAGLRAELRGAEASRAEQRARPTLELIEELPPEYGPELSFLSGQVRELLLAAKAAERRGVKFALRSAEKGAKAKTLVTELNELAPQLNTLRRRYQAANLRDLQLVQEGIFRYFPSADAGAVKELRKISNNSIVRLLEEVRGTAFAGDLSPILGVQLPLGALFDPKLAVQRLVGAGRGSIQSRDLLRTFRAQTLADDVARDLDGWKDFSFWSGLPGTVGTPQEFSGGLLRFIPGFTRANEAMFSVVTRQSKALYDKQLAILGQTGLKGDSAKMIAADMATKAYPIWNPRRLGLSPARAAAVRAVPTSVSFLLRPAALIGEASTGFAKMAAMQSLKPQERLAVRLMVTLAGSTMALSVTSAVLSALARGKDPFEAAKDVTDPTSGKFGSIVVGTRRIPLAGPFRGMIKAIVPREVGWAPVPVPFANIGNFVKNRINPFARTQLDLALNEDFFGTTIRKGKAPEQILRSLLFELEGTAPLSLGAGIEGVRRGEPVGEIFEEVGAQFAGTNLSRETAGQERQLARDRKTGSARLRTLDGSLARKWNDLNRAQQRKLLMGDDEALRLDEAVKDELYRRSNDQERARIDAENTARTDFFNEMLAAVPSLGSSRRLYDKQRTRARTIYSGRRQEVWNFRQALESDSVQAIEKWIAGHQLPEDAALDAYFERQQELIDAERVLDSQAWDRIQRGLQRFLNEYPPATRRYVTDNLNAWIEELPEPVRSIELQRQREIDTGRWFRFYDRPARVPLPPTPTPVVGGALPPGAGAARPIRVPGIAP